MELSIGGIDLAVVLLYLIGILAVGLWAGAGTKDLKDYSIAGKVFGLPMLFMTILATDAGGNSLMGKAAQIYKDGIIVLSIAVAVAAHYLVAGRYIFPLFNKRFEGAISAGDIVRRYYGETAERISAVVAVASGVGAVGIQMIAVGTITSALTGLPYEYGVVVGGTVTIVYSSIGGMRAVTVTDAVQCVLLISMLPILSSLSLYNLGFNQVFSSLPSTHLQVINHPNSSIYISRCISLMCCVSIFSPAMVQRCLMAQSKKQISRAFYYNALALLLIASMVFCVSIGVMTQFHVEKPNEVSIIAINRLLPPFAKGMAIVGALSMVMSTLDSHLNSASIIGVHNLVRVFYKEGCIPHELFLVRVTSLAIGLFAICFAINYTDIFRAGIIFGSVWVILGGLPIMMTVIGLRVFYELFWINACSSAACLLICVYVMHLSTITTTAICTVFGIIVSIASIIIYRKGNIWDPEAFEEGEDEADLQQRLETKMAFMQRMSRYSIFNIPSLIKNSIILSKDEPIYVSIFICVIYVLPFFMWNYQKPSLYPEVVAFRLLSASLAAIVFFKNYWPAYMKRYFPYYWYLTLFFSLAFTPSYMMINELSNPFWVTNGALSIMFLAMIIEWKGFLTCIVLGPLLALGISSYKDVPVEALDPIEHTVFDTTYYTCYVLSIAAIIGLVFARGRQQDFSSKMEEQDFYCSAMAHEAKSPISSMSMSIKSLQEVINNNSMRKDGEILIKIKKEDAAYYDQRMEACAHLANHGPHDMDVILMSTRKEIPHSMKKRFSVKQLIKESIEDYPFHHDYKGRIGFDDCGEDFEVYTCPAFLKTVFYNMYKNAISHAFDSDGTQMLFVSIRGNTVRFKDTGKGIKPADLPYIFNRFHTGSRDGTGIGLAFCEHVMQDLGGYIDCKSVEGEGTEFILNFPYV